MSIRPLKHSIMMPIHRQNEIAAIEHFLGFVVPLLRRAAVNEGQEAILQWMERNIKGNWQADLCQDPYSADNRNNELCVSFQDYNDALMFKLKWCHG